MGISKLVDAVLFIYFLIITIFAPLIDSQTCLPSHLFPDVLIQAKSWYAHQYGDYLVLSKPDFFVGLVALELLVQWPLSIANLYAILGNKSWFGTTCLIQGVSTVTSMVAILSDMVRSEKASDKMYTVYVPFFGLSLLAVLRGLVPAFRKTNVTLAARSTAGRKKRA